MCRCRSSRWHPRNGARPAGPHARDAGQPLLGERDVWQHWFNSAGLRIPVNPVATFNDAGMMLQAAEQGLGIALGRELLAADALCAGRLVQLSTVRVQYEQAQTYHLVYRPSLRATGRRWSRSSNGCATNSSCRASRWSRTSPKIAPKARTQK